MRPRTTSSRSDGFIEAADSKVKILVVKTNEELAIARDTLELAARRRKAGRAEKQTKFLLRAKNSLTKRGLPSIIGKWLCAR